MTTSALELVTLTGGMVVPLSALQVLWDLETRGFDLRLDHDGRQAVGPSARINEEDRRLLREHRGALRELVGYCARVQ